MENKLSLILPLIHNTFIHLFVTLQDKSYIFFPAFAFGVHTSDSFHSTLQSPSAGNAPHSKPPAF